MPAAFGAYPEIVFVRRVIFSVRPVSYSQIEAHLFHLLMPPTALSNQDLCEFETRRQKIDVLLKEQGWHVGDR